MVTCTDIHVMQIGDPYPLYANRICHVIPMALIFNRCRVHLSTKLRIINICKRSVSMEAGAYDPSKLTVEEKKNLIVRNLEVKESFLNSFFILLCLIAPVCAVHVPNRSGGDRRRQARRDTEGAQSKGVLGYSYYRETAHSLLRMYQQDSRLLKGGM